MLNPLREEHKSININNGEARAYVWTGSGYEYKKITDKPILDYVTKDGKC